MGKKISFLTSCLRERSVLRPCDFQLLYIFFLCCQKNRKYFIFTSNPESSQPGMNSFFHIPDTNIKRYFGFLSCLLALLMAALGLSYVWLVVSGLIDIKCHEKFKKCIKKVQKSGKVGFSRACPYETAVPTMVQGMDLAILLSQFGNSKDEL